LAVQVSGDSLQASWLDLHMPAEGVPAEQTTLGALQAVVCDCLIPSVTVLIEFRTGLPLASWMVTAGCVVNAAPATAPAGCVVNARFFATEAMQNDEPGAEV
jgi:hypothetical protein